MRSAAAALACLFAGQAIAQEGQLQPWQMVRSLQLVQDRLADGDHAALPMQRKLLEMIDARLRRAAPAEFDDQHNFRALLVYAMSGGNPATVRIVSSKLTVEDDRKQLSDGVTQYVAGRLGEAQKTFASIDPLAYPSELGSFLALIKGAVSIEQMDVAVLSFDQARLLAPGTLVEEAALRRLLTLHSERGDARRFEAAALQYVTRFLRSPYATQFAEAYVAGVARLHDRIAFAAIEEAVAHMNDEQAKVIYLRLARRSAVEGYADMLAFASGMAARWADPAKGEADPRAQLYASLGSITSDNVAEVLAALRAIDRSRLSREDREFLVAAEAIAARVTALPAGMTRPAAPVVKVAETPKVAPAAAAPEPEDDGPIAGLLSAGKSKIQAIDEMLRETTQ